MSVRAVGVTLAVVVLLPVVFLAVRSAFAPGPPPLGLRDGKLAPCPSTPNCVSSQAPGTRAFVEPIPFEGAPGAALERARRALEALPRTRVVAEGPGYLRAESTTLLFRFVDDVEVALDAPGRLLHVRSASRTGTTDFGTNRRRVEAFRALFARG